MIYRQDMAQPLSQEMEEGKGMQNKGAIRVKEKFLLVMVSCVFRIGGLSVPITREEEYKNVRDQLQRKYLRKQTIRAGLIHVTVAIKTSLPKEDKLLRGRASRAFGALGSLRPRTSIASYYQPGVQRLQRSWWRSIRAAPVWSCMEPFPNA